MNREEERAPQRIRRCSVHPLLRILIPFPRSETGQSKPQSVLLEGVPSDIEERDEEAHGSQCEEEGVGNVFGHSVAEEGYRRENEPLGQVVITLHDDIAAAECQNTTRTSHNRQVANWNGRARRGTLEMETAYSWGLLFFCVSSPSGARGCVIAFLLQRSPSLALRPIPE